MTCNALRCPRSTEWKEKVFGIRLIHLSLCTKFIQHPCLCLFSQHLWHRESSSLVAELPVISFQFLHYYLTFPAMELHFTVCSCWLNLIPNRGHEPSRQCLTIHFPQLNASSLPTTSTTSTTVIPDLYKPWFPQSETGQALSLKIVLYPHRLMETSLARQHDFICTSTGRW